MRIPITLYLALLAMAAAGCCPGSMTGQGMAHVDERPAVAPATQAVDSDGDGVPDYMDHCPDTPRGVAVDQYGCPKDSDGDGVPDYLDRCPDTPRGERVNGDGCSDAQLAAMAPPPPPKPAPSRAEQELTTSGSIKLENVYFDSGKATLTPDSSAPLDEAGAALEKYPDLRLEVEGHTDSRGAAAFNLRLSQARAGAVRKYLLDHFKLRPANVTAKGYGEKGASQDTSDPEALRRDRRVVLRVLNPEALPKNVELKQ